MKNFFNKTISTGCYVGYAPLSGTLGSLEGLVIFLFIGQYFEGWQQNTLIGLGILGFTILSFALGGWAERYYGHKDPSHFVIDEIAGYLVAVIFIDFMQMTFWLIVLGFVIFRLLDIIKPFPAKQAQRLSGGLGIVLDDLIVGIYTNILLHLIIYLWPGLIKT